MTILVAGSTGKTGGPLVEQLLNSRHRIRVIVRSRERLPAAVRGNQNIAVIEASILDLSDEQMAERVKGYDAIVSCLGHVISFKGMYGAPRKLCMEATRRLCEAIERNVPAEPLKFILMNTVGVPNPDLHEPRTWNDRLLLSVLRHLVPPHDDNETALNRLHRHVGRRNPHIEWSIVRPDSLIDADVSSYDITGSPVTGILSGRPTSRANVAHFMTQLI
jgi:nucleoside-diphosphate-sugar epimerase